MYILDFLKNISVYSNHPVHIIDKDKRLSPSSFIPFCQFGNLQYGITLEQFNQPVCNLFKEKIIKDQLCYGADLNIFQGLKNFSEGNVIGLSFLVDSNQDRQMSYSSELGKSNDKTTSFGKNKI